MNERDYTIESGDGGSKRLRYEELEQFRRHISHMSSEYRNGTSPLNGRVDTSHQTRYAVWPNQHPDGRKHKCDDCEDPKPFDGASDIPVRLADMVVNFYVMLIMSATSRLTVGVTGMERTDDPLAASVTTLLNYLREHHLGRYYRLAIERVANYMLADSPAIGFLGVYWEPKIQNLPQEVTPESLTEMEVAATLARLMEGANGEDLAPEEQAYLAEAIEEVQAEMEELFEDSEPFIRMENLGSNPPEIKEQRKWRREQIAEVLATHYPGLRKGTYSRVARDLMKFAAAEEPEETPTIPMPVESGGRLIFDPLRLYHDLHIPPDIRDMRDAGVVFTREWVNVFELRSRQHTRGYARKFIDQVEEFNGATGFAWCDSSLWGGDGFQGVGEFGTDTSTWMFFHGEESPYYQRYEIVTAYHWAVNRDNIPGLYATTFHCEVETAAKERELLGEDSYPFVDFVREATTPYLLDSRSIPELLSAAQTHIKKHTDAATNNAELGAVPPLMKSAMRPDYKVNLAPMAQISEVRPNEVRWMEPPTYPKAALEVVGLTMGRIAQYWGLHTDEVDPELRRLHGQHVVDGFLGSLKDAWKMGLRLAAENIPEPELHRILGRQDVTSAQLLEAITGGYDLVLQYRVENQDIELLTARLNFVVQLVQGLDREQILKVGPIVTYFAQAFDPALADRIVQPSDQASRKEIEDEQMNLMKIASGIPVTHAEDGQNFGARLEYLQKFMAESDFLQRLDETAVMQLQERMKHLQFQVQQRTENPVIGRVGVSQDPNAAPQ